MKLPFLSYLYVFCNWYCHKLDCKQSIYDFHVSFFYICKLAKNSALLQCKWICVFVHKQKKFIATGCISTQGKCDSNFPHLMDKSFSQLIYLYLYCLYSFRYFQLIFSNTKYSFTIAMKFRNSSIAFTKKKLSIVSLLFFARNNRRFQIFPSRIIYIKHWIRILSRTLSDYSLILYNSRKTSSETTIVNPPENSSKVLLKHL